MAYKKLLIRMLIWGVALFMLFATILGASAFEVDGDDSFYVSPGDTVEGAFIISETSEIYDVETEFPWLSFEEGNYVNFKTISGGQYVSEDAYLVKYWIKVPDDADISVHRTTISVSDRQETKYVNVKVSVQSSLFRTVLNALNKPTAWAFIFGFMLLLITITAILTTPSGGKR